MQLDNAGRVTSRCESDGVETRYRYDERGWLAEISNELTSITYERDAVGNVTAETVRAASGEQSHVKSVGGGVSIAVCDQEPVVVEYARDEEYPTVLGVRVLEAGREVAQLGFGADISTGSRRIVAGSVIRDIAVDQRGRRVRDVVRKIPSGDDVGVDDFPVVAGRMWGWRGDGAVEEIVDHLRGKATIDLDAVGRVTRFQRTSHAAELADSSEEFRYSAAGVVESMGSSVAADVRGGSRLSSRMEYQGTRVRKVGRRYYTYDALGRVTKIVVKRVSLPPLVQQFRYLGSSGLVSEFSSSDAKRVCWRYFYDPRGRRVAKTCVDVATGAVVSSQWFAYFGDVLVGEVTTTGDAEDGVVGRFWLHDPASGEVVGQLDRVVRAGGGAREWSQAQVDAVFYALVADLAGAPQELVDVASGEVAGQVRQSVFGVRDWDGVASPLLFAGQYVDSESGWVYNRFRFYDPYAGVYTSQDPLGVDPNPGGAQLYVHNPLTWIDFFGLLGCSEEVAEALEHVAHDFDLVVKQENKKMHSWQRKRGYNIAAMVTSDGKIYYATGAEDRLDEMPKGMKANNVTIITSEDAPWPKNEAQDEIDLDGVPANGLDRVTRRPLHAEQKLLRYADQQGLTPVTLVTNYRACPNSVDEDKEVEESYGRYLTCSDALEKAGMYCTNEKEDTGNHVYRLKSFVPRLW